MSQKRSANDEIKPAELSSETLATLDAIEKDHHRLIVADEFQSIQRFAPFYEKRREKLKKIPQFWFGALQNDPTLLSMHGSHPEDLEALKYLEDIWVTRHQPDPRAFTLEMHFKENPFFSNKVLTKEYKLKTPPSGEIVDGIYDSMLEFDPDTHLKLSTMKIDWKNDKMNLFKKYPRSQKNEDEDELMDSDDLGSFFTFFEAPDDDMGIGSHIAGDLFSNPILFFKGEIDEDEDEEISSSESGDSDAEEIDLERPKKRAKRA